MSTTNWMLDSTIQDIDSKKIQFLQMLFFEGNNLSEKERLPFFLSIATRARKDHISFTEDEVERIVEVLKKSSNPQELQKINQILQMFKNKSASTKK
ncbi:MAG: hypothetical protein PHE02_15060 [Lachnospiraceae bacterium]|nr:hypothetical protein [Lachnospiraceae bacterium]